MKSPIRARARIVLLIAAALLLAAWCLPPFFHAGRYRHVLQAALKRALGRPVTLGAVSVRLLPHPGFTVYNVLIAEDPRFGAEPFARVSRLECDLRWSSLWTSRVDCARIVLDHPDLNVVRNDRGRLNIEDFFLSRTAISGKRSPTPKMRAPAGLELDVEDARLNFIAGITKTDLAVTGLSGALVIDPPSGSIRFQFAGSPVRTGLPVSAAPGTIELSGEWKPGKDFRGPFTALVSTQGSLLYGWIPLFTARNPEIYGLASAGIHVAGTADRLTFHGETRLEQLHRWESLPPASSMPVDVAFAGSYNRLKRRLFIRTADATFVGSHLHIAGTISHLPAAPATDPTLNLVMAVQHSRLSDLVSMVSRLSGNHSHLEIAGRVDGLLTVQGPWREERYGGFVGVRSFWLREHAVSFQAPELGVQIGKAGARLLPVRLRVAQRIECIAKGSLLPVLPGSLRKLAGSSGAGEREAKLRLIRSPSRRPRTLAPLATSSYELTLSATQASLRALSRLALSAGVRSLRDLSVDGRADATVRLEGAAWPFTMPRLTAKADLEQGRLFVPGLTEPLRFRRFHLDLRDHHVRIDPLVAQIGPTVFSGWVSHQEARAKKNPWVFDARAPRLSIEQASLWFAALGHRSPLPILDLIPGLSSLVAGRWAGRNIFAALRAQGSFESPLVTYRSLGFRNVRASIRIADRVAIIDRASFAVAGGQGNGSGRVDFKQRETNGKFTFQGGRLDQLTRNFPPDLRRVRGAFFAAGHFTAHGLTSQEMSASLEGKASLSFRNVSFGSFDPLQAIAQAASLGSLATQSDSAHLAFAQLRLSIAHRQIDFQPSRAVLSGAILELQGDCGFNGVANLLIDADLNGVTRRWMSVARAPLIVANDSQGGADSVPENQPTDAAPRPGGAMPSYTSGAPGTDGASSFPSLAQQGRFAVLHLDGPLNDLTLARGVQQAKLGISSVPGAFSGKR
jgi:hypothetical protein